MAYEMVITTGDDVRNHILLRADLTRKEMGKARRLFSELTTADAAAKNLIIAAAEAEQAPDYDVVEGHEDTVCSVAAKLLDTLCEPGQEVVDRVIKRGIPDQVGRVAVAVYYRTVAVYGTAIAEALNVPKAGLTPSAGILPPPPTV